jgi:hypothetical protein
MGRCRRSKGLRVKGLEKAIISKIYRPSKKEGIMKGIAKRRLTVICL